MNIIIYSHKDFFRLICYSISFGLVSGTISCVIGSLLAIRYVNECRDLHSLSVFLSKDLAHRLANGRVNDFISLILIAVSLLFVSFMANSGSFRLVSVPLLLLGFFGAIRSLKKIIVYAVCCVYIIIKHIFGIVTFPIRFVSRGIVSICKKYIIIIEKYHKSKIITKYTEKRFNKIDEVKQSGLLDKWYEVV